MTYERHDYGPLQSYEIVWMSGHVETVQAHQISWPNAASGLFGQPASNDPFVRIHGMFGTHWRLVLQVREAEIATIRNVTAAEVLLPGGDDDAEHLNHGKGK